MSHKIKALVVDDEELIRLSLMSALKKGGFSADAAGNGDEALEMIRKSDYDIVITDYKMPGMNGLELLERLKEEGKKSKVILISAYLSQSTLKMALEYGVFKCVDKPFGMNDFVKIVQEAAAHISSF